MMPPRIVKHYYEFYKVMERYGLDLASVQKASSDELSLWYQYHRHLTDHYSKIIDVDNMSYTELMEFKDIFDIHNEFKARLHT